MSATPHRPQRSLGRDAALTLAIKLAAAATSYGFVFVLSQNMALADFGFVGALMTGAFVLSVLGAMGQQVAMLRYLPPLIAARDHRAVAATWRRALRLSLAGSLTLWAMGAGLGYLAAAAGYIGDWRAPALGLALVVLLCRIDMQASLARAFRAIALALIPKEVLWRAIAGAAILALAAFWGGGRPVGLYPAIITLIIVLAALTLVQGALIGRRIDAAQAGKAPCPAQAAAEWRASVVPFWVFSVSAIYFANIDVALAGFFFGGSEAAGYFLANRIAQALAFFLISYNIAIQPALSERFAAQGRGDLAPLVARASLGAFLPTLVLALFLWLWAAPLLRLFGPEFPVAAPLLQVLVLAGVLNAAFGPGDLVLTMCAEDRAAMKISLWSIGLGTLAMPALALGLGWGTAGIAWGVCIAVVFRKGASWALARRRLGISSDVISAALTLARGPRRQGPRKLQKVS